MIFLILLIIFFALFNVIMRAAQRRALNLYLLGVTLFFTAAAFYLVLCLRQPVALSPQVIVLGIVAGVLFNFMYVLMIPTMSDRGVSIMTALQQLSLLFPLLASLVLYHEHPSLVNAIGAGLCLVAMPFLSLDKGLSGEGVTGRKLLIFIGLMVVNGVALTASKVFYEFRLPEQLNGYMLILTATAGVTMLPFAITGRRSTPPKPPVQTAAWGVAMGLSLALGQMFMLLTLRYYPGVVAYPVTQALNVSLVTLGSGFLWKEWPRPLARVGIVLAIVAVVLVNL